jgi:creatinine amidohydrolase
MLLRLETLFPVELERHLAVSPVLVLPYGTIEWHSHHLPVGLDGIVAQRMGEAMAEAMNAVLAPTGYWAVGGVPFPFTLNLPLDAIESLIGISMVPWASTPWSCLPATSDSTRRWQPSAPPCTR